jgi:mRNA interferase MazF
MKNQIVLVPFPFDDLSATKVRPALCLTDKMNSYGHVVIAFITSNTQNLDVKTDIEIDANSTNFKQTGLKVSSAIRLHKLVCVSSKIIVRQLGIMPTHFETDIKIKLKNIFEL